MAGFFISLDGLDGTGKSTQCRLLAEWLRQRGRAVTVCRDPGGTPLGDQLRQIVLDHRQTMSPACEAFLFMASRSELMAQIIAPALARNEVVICDRFLLATVVYQGHAGGLNPADLWRIGQVATGGRLPDLTIVLDLPVDEALIRRGRAPDRMEARSRGYHEAVRQGFLEEAARQPSMIKVVPAVDAVETIQQRIREIVQPRLGT
jgi:dTMP kinase